MRIGDILLGLPKYHFSHYLCKSCVANKHSRSDFPNASEFRASKRLELIHSDICGLIQPSTLGGRRYYFLSVDDSSQLIWVVFLKEKSEAFQCFKWFKNLAESQSGEKIKSLRISGDFKGFQKLL